MIIFKCDQCKKVINGEYLDLGCFEFCNMKCYKKWNKEKELDA